MLIQSFVKYQSRLVPFSQQLLFFFFTVFVAHNMEKKGSQFQPDLGICQRLLDFFMDSLIARGLKRITLGRADAVPRSSVDAAVVGGSFRNGVDSVVEQKPLSLERSNGQEKLHHRAQESSKLDDSIQVQFKQTEEGELEYWTPIDNLGSSIHEPIKATPSSTSHGPIKVTEPSQHKEELPLVHVNGSAAHGRSSHSAVTHGKGPVDTETNANTVARAKPPKKVVHIQHGKEEDKSRKGKRIPLEAESLTLAIEQEPPKYKFPRHLISVASNINEKSDAFIKNKKESMRNNQL